MSGFVRRAPWPRIVGPRALAKGTSQVRVVAGRSWARRVSSGDRASERAAFDQLVAKILFLASLKLRFY
jgi:hypothetical protein